MSKSKLLGSRWQAWLFSFSYIRCTLQWRHNGYDSVSNHQPHDCLPNRLFRRRSKKTTKLRVTGLCAGNSPGPVNSPHKGPVTRKMFPFDDVIMVVERYWGIKSLGFQVLIPQIHYIPRIRDRFRTRFVVVCCCLILANLPIFLESYITGTAAILRLTLCHLSKPVVYGTVTPLI